MNERLLWVEQLITMTFAALLILWNVSFKIWCRVSWHILRVIIDFIGSLVASFHFYIGFSFPIFLPFGSEVLGSRLWAAEVDSWALPLVGNQQAAILLSAATQIWVAHTSCSRWAQSNSSNCRLNYSFISLTSMWRLHSCFIVKIIPDSDD